MKLYVEDSHGMTLRDYFAAKAMSAVITNRLEEARTSGNTYKTRHFQKLLLKTATSLPMLC
ncbi:MAG: hypothetical protein ACK5PF_00630 [bacterium]|jgi:hypothetical protein